MASSIITAPAARSLTRNPIYVTLETDEMSGGSPPYSIDQENLSCRLEVWRDTDAGEEMLARIKSPYSTTDKRTTFDISRLFPRVVALPSAASIGVSGGDPLYGEAVGLVDTYRLKHADQYGDPVAAEALTTSSDYLAINGGVPADALQSINYAGSAIGLHSYFYKRHDAFVFLKPVARTQPDWMYFVSLVDDTFSIVVTIRYDDGTTEFYTALEMADLEADTAYWVQSGYNQLKIDDYADSEKTVVGYNVSLIRETGGQNTFTLFYVIDDVCPSWERYILYHNGMGGYETVRMKGIATHSHAVERQRFQRTRWNDFSIETGVTDDLTVQGSPEFNIHTGHYPAYYIEHLRQLLHGKLWLIDQDLSLVSSYRFKRVLCDTNRVELRTDVPSADGFAINIRHAWDDDGYNVF